MQQTRASHLPASHRSADRECSTWNNRAEAEARFRRALRHTSVVEAPPGECCDPSLSTLCWGKTWDECWQS